MATLAGRKRRHPRVIAESIDADPHPPTWLPREARAEWRRIVKLAAHFPQWLQQLDRGALTAWSMSWWEFQEAAKNLAERGPLVPARSSADHLRADADGPHLVRNPAAAVMRDAANAMHKWGTALGLTPAARAALDRGPQERDDLEDLLSPQRLLT